MAASVRQACGVSGRHVSPSKEPITARSRQRSPDREWAIDQPLPRSRGANLVGGAGLGLSFRRTCRRRQMMISLSECIDFEDAYDRAIVQADSVRGFWVSLKGVRARCVCVGRRLSGSVLFPLCCGGLLRCSPVGPAPCGGGPSPFP